MNKKKIPGSVWRVLAKDGDEEVSIKNKGIFDELVVDNWLHIEQMDNTNWWIRIADARIDVKIGESGKPVISIERDVYD